VRDVLSDYYRERRFTGPVEAVNSGYRSNNTGRHQIIQFHALRETLVNSPRDVPYARDMCQDKPLALLRRKSSAGRNISRERTVRVHSTNR
jgi:hypothetical protein